MQSTAATGACLYLTYPTSVTVEQTQGATVGLQQPVSDGQQQMLKVPIGNIQYGQSRDVYLRYKVDTGAGSQVLLNVDLGYSHMTSDFYRVTTWCNLADGLPQKPPPGLFNHPPPSAAEAAFHISRSMLCAFLASIFPVDDTDEHRTPTYVASHGTTELDELIATLPAAAPDHASDAACAALMADVNGQVRLALSKPQYYDRWGKHYLPSLQSAHAAQQCNSFKDPGPLTYAAASPLFIACRNALDTAFDTLPPPKPSKSASYSSRLGRARGLRSTTTATTTTSSHSISMSSYHNSSGPCFASFCRVTLADGRRIRVNRLRGGMRVQTPRGTRTVAAVMKTPVSSIPMVVIGRLLITAWHPVSHNGAKWVFPCRDPAANKNATVRYTGSIYSVLLQPDEDADAHAVNIEGVWVVTLGHGLTEKNSSGSGVVNNDVRVHRFFGDYDAVCRSMATLDLRKDGLVVNGGSARSNFRQWHTRK